MFSSILKGLIGSRVGFVCVVMIRVIVATGTYSFLSFLGPKGLAYEQSKQN